MRAGDRDIARQPNPKDFELVYGHPDPDTLVFIPKRKALEIIAKWEAWHLQPKTWGELRAQTTPAAYEALLEGIREFYDELPKGWVPQDDEEFDLYSLPGLNDAGMPEWPEQYMLSWVPESIREKYGTVDWSLFDGEFLQLDAKREQEIVKAFQELGYICVRDEDLVRQARGD